jgi:hypothetical protein
MVATMSPTMPTILAQVWQPVAAPAAIFCGAAVLALLAVAAYARSFREHPVASAVLGFMRLEAIAVLAVLLMGPSRLPPQTLDQKRPTLTIFLDTSQSMLTPDCRGAARIDSARSEWLDGARLDALSEDFTVELLAFDEQLRPLPRAALAQPAAQVATGEATHLAENLAAGLARLPEDDSGAAVLVLSDGRDSAEAPLAPAIALAQARGLPVFTVGFGGEVAQGDLAVVAVPLQDYLLPGEPGTVLVKVYQAGLDGASTTVRLRHAGQERTAAVTFAGQQVLDVPFEIIHDEGGQQEYVVSVDAAEIESETGNNQQTLFVNVHDRRIRVLVVEGQPFWDSKFLAHSLRKDERVELTQITQVSEAKRETIITRTGDDAVGLPRSAEAWATYDVVILGQAVERLLPPDGASQLAAYVERGGHLLFARGLAYDPQSPAGAQMAVALAAVEPVVWGEGFAEDAPLALTAAGRGAPWLDMTALGLRSDDALSRLPGLSAMPAIEREKPGTLVLARAMTPGKIGPPTEGAAALVTMPYGRGSVAALLGDGAWQWSLLAPENEDLAGFYDAFWSNLLRFMALGGDFQPGQQVALQLSRTSARLGDELVLNVVYKHTPPGGAHPRLEITSPDGTTRELALAALPGRDPRFRATLAPEGAGVYQAELVAAGMTPERQARKFSVYDVSLERLNASADHARLASLAEQTGGAFFASHQADELASRLHRHSASLVVPPRLEYVWDQWWVMAALLAWAGAEWLLRRAAGMI